VTAKDSVVANPPDSITSAALVAVAQAAGK